MLHQGRQKTQQTELDQLMSSAHEQQAIIDLYKADINAIESLGDWFKKTPALEPNQTSRAHQIIENHTIISPQAKFKKATSDAALATAKSFVVRHDWHSALGVDFSNTQIEVKLPFPRCLFEFIYSGRCVSLLAVEEVGTQFGISCLPYIQIHEAWYLAPKESVEKDPVFALAYLQILAICVALDANIAMEFSIAAPTSLNKKRSKRGKPPIKNHYLIDINPARRLPRQSNPNEEPLRRHRLHFRRGHWRHLPEKKTWINWMLVGDPCLGFIEKNYSI